MTVGFDSVRFFQRLGWWPAKIFLACFCRIEVDGLEHLEDLPGNAILAGNHVSAADPLLVATCLPPGSDKLPVVFVTRERQAHREIATSWRRHLYGGRFFEILGGYPAYAGTGDYAKALQHHLAAIAAGRSVCIFPVGRLHRVDQIFQARGGAAYLAKKTGRPIVPFKIAGNYWPGSLAGFFRRRPRLGITFGQPIRVEDIFDSPLEEVSETDQAKFEKASVKLMQIIVRL